MRRNSCVLALLFGLMIASPVPARAEIAIAMIAIATAGPVTGQLAGPDETQWLEIGI
jgi:hypothetical protein